jgi:hypothetical protein
VHAMDIFKAIRIKSSSLIIFFIYIIVTRSDLNVLRVLDALMESISSTILITQFRIDDTMFVRLSNYFLPCFFSELFFILSKWRTKISVSKV